MKLIELYGASDHVHLRVNSPPQLAVSCLVGSLKGVPRRLLMCDYLGIAIRHYHRGIVWTPNYFTSRCGGAPISIIKQYIEQHQTPC